MNEIDFKQLYANQVVIYQLLCKIIDKLENRSRFTTIETYEEELTKHANEVVKLLK